jgi:hypothetical protein
VEAACVVTPNLLTFQLIMGYDVLETYIPTNNTTGVDALWAEWNTCPDSCTPIVMGDLNISFKHPREEREEAITDLLDEIKLVDLSCKFCLLQCWLQLARRRWAWWQKRTGRWNHSQPDYIIAREGNIWYFRKVAFYRRWSMTQTIVCHYNFTRKEDAMVDSILLLQTMPSSAAPTQAAQQIDPHLQGTETNVRQSQPPKQGRE